MANQSPKVSIILPTYNRTQIVGRAIRSVLNQSYRNYELIVIDDGSTDNTAATIKGFDDPRIRYIQHENNRGGSAARNTGIASAKGEYIAFQDSDDEWLPQKLEKQMSVFDDMPEAPAIVYTASLRIKGNKAEHIPSDRVRKKKGNIYSEIVMGNFVCMPSVVVKKTCFEKIGMFDEVLPRLQDWDLFIRMSKEYEFDFVDEPLVIAYFTADSISSNTNSELVALKIILEKNYIDFSKSRKVLARFQLMIGRSLFRHGNTGEGLKCLFRSTILWPPALINWLGAALNTQ